MQQINLYQSSLRPPEQSFSARSVMLGSALALIVIVLFYVYAHWQTRQLEAQAAQYEHQRDEAKKLINDLWNVAPAAGKSTALAEDVARLQNQLQQKQQVITRFQQHHHGNSSGYSAHLEGLARQRLPQLWLTHIGLLQGGSVVELYGSALAAEQVPQFLQRLSAEAAFHGLEFQQFSLTRSEKGPQQVDFVLLTERRGTTP